MLLNNCGNITIRGFSKMALVPRQWGPIHINTITRIELAQHTHRGDGVRGLRATSHYCVFDVFINS